jgi:hypothetical protein
MPKTVTVTLRDPFEGHSGMVKEIVLREPRAKDYFELGEVRTLTRNDKGNVHLQENGEALQKYFERCIQGDALLAISSMSLADSMQVKEAIFGFFDQALLAASPLPATSSSSNSD